MYGTLDLGVREVLPHQSFTYIIMVIVAKCAFFNGYFISTRVVFYYVCFCNLNRSSSDIIHNRIRKEYMQQTKYHHPFTPSSLFGRDNNIRERHSDLCSCSDSLNDSPCLSSPHLNWAVFLSVC
jgi:hypothetical protein